MATLISQKCIPASMLQRSQKKRDKPLSVAENDELTSQISCFRYSEGLTAQWTLTFPSAQPSQCSNRHRCITRLLHCSLTGRTKQAADSKTDMTTGPVLSWGGQTCKMVQICRPRCGCRSCRWVAQDVGAGPVHSSTLQIWAGGQTCSPPRTCSAQSC